MSDKYSRSFLTISQIKETKTEIVADERLQTL